MSRRPAPALALVVAGLMACSGARPAPKPPLFPPQPAWKTLLDDNVVAPLASDGRRVFVATRDGAVRALDPATGAELWKVDGLPGRLSAREAVLVVRHDSGAITSLHPRSGAVRWRSETGVAGELPALVDGDRVHVAGRGVASLLLETGAPVFLDAAAPETTAPPVATRTLLLTGDSDGMLRCRARADGSILWTLPTRAALAAAPLVDEARNRLYLGTTDKRILEASLDKGDPGWAWRIGADAAHTGLRFGGWVLFAPHDAVLYALSTGGNLAWRVALPSRPLSAPLLVDDRIVIACLENVLVSISTQTGALEGAFKTAGEIRTAPIHVAGLLVLGMRDKSVIAYALGPAPAPVADPADPGAQPVPPPARPVEGPPAGR